ncbi:MAG: hypothetical protein EU548_06400, partial [Promethearchaeota archaeon]
MLKSKWKIKIKVIFLIIITFGMGLTSTNLLYSHNSSIQDNPNSFRDTIIDNKEITEDTLPKSSEYQEFGGSGEQLNITLHQSLVNASNIEFTNLDNFNTFNEPVPNFSGYNTSYINVTVDAINAPNKTIIVEDDLTIEAINPVNYQYLGFEARGIGYLENISLHIRETNDIDLTQLSVYLYNSTDVSGSPRPDSKVYSSPIIDDVEITSTTFYWHDFTQIHAFINSSKTFDNYFFLELEKSGGGGTTNIALNGTFDTVLGDNLDESIVVSNDKVTLHTVGGINVDAALIIDFAPVDNTPKPSDINLQMNNTAVADDLSGSNLGYWTPSEVYSSSTGEFEFSITADWWDVSCNVSNVHINYTKTDIKANTDFSIPASTQDVNWTATIPSGLEYFDGRLDNFNTINFTIPVTWQDATIKVFNNTDPFTNLIKTVLGNGYREVQVLNAGNGSNWYLTANSTNLVSSIDTYVNGIPMTIMNYTNTIRFNGSFSKTISDGNLNLSVYSPVPSYLNHSSIFPISTSSDELLISDWDISSSATDYGVFKAQLTWNNDTAAGFLELFFTIVANTDFILDSPQSGIDRFDNEIFNIIVFYNDTGPDLGDIGITEAIITEDSSLLGSSTPTGTDGYYSLQCDVSLFSYGWVFIEINASKSFYHNQSLIFSFHHRINTSLTPSNNYNFGEIIRGDLASYTFNYSDILGNAILGATIQEVSLPSGMVSNPFEEGGAPGNYTIELDTSNVQASASAYTCIFNITAIGKQTQIINLIITITQAQTSLSINSYIGILNRKDGFDQQIEFFFNDTDNEEGVPGVPMSNITVTDNQTGGSRPINSLTPFGATGNYRLNVSLDGLNSGWIQLTVNVSKDPDYNWSIDYFSFYLRGNSTITTIESIRDVGGQGVLTPTVLNYSVYIGLNININFTIQDTDYGNDIVTGDANSYTANYYEISNPINQGILSNALDFDLNTNSYRGIISTLNLGLGTYAINISILKTNYEQSNVIFNLTIKPKIIVNISVIERPEQVSAGGFVNITLKVEYFNGTVWKALSGVSVTILPNFNGINGTATGSIYTDINGTVTFTEIAIATTVNTMILYAVLSPTYNHTGFTRAITDITVIPPLTTFEELLPYLIIGGIILLAVVGSIGVYRGVVVPKKREKQRVLTEVKTIFDDAINLEHILVLYKATGTCIFFKS